MNCHPIVEGKREKKKKGDHKKIQEEWWGIGKGRGGRLRKWEKKKVGNQQDKKGRREMQN